MYLKVKICYFLCVISSAFPGNTTIAKGRGMRGKIIGGVKADIESYPYLVWVTMKYVRRTTFCGGSYIAPLWVLTAAHCIDINNDKLDQRPQIGEYMTSITCTMGMTNENEVDKTLLRKTVKLMMHPSYARNMHGSRNDIALIELEKPFQLSAKCQMISLPSNRMDYSGKTVIIMGYGLISSETVNSMLDKIIAKTSGKNDTEEQQVTTEEYDEEDDYYPMEDMALSLRALNVSVRPMEECRKRTGNPSVICVGEKDKIPCQWDSGGPLVYNNVVIGIGSRLIHECAEDYGRYEDVFVHVVWINSFVKFRSSCGRITEYLSLIITILYIIYMVEF